MTFMVAPESHTDSRISASLYRVLRMLARLRVAPEKYHDTWCAFIDREGSQALHWDSLTGHLRCKGWIG